MSILRLIVRSIAQRKLSSTLTAVSVALGVALVGAILLIKDEMKRSYQGQGQGYGLVVGAPGSALQLVLNTVFHVDESPGLIPFSVLEELQKNPWTKLAVPYAVGDSFRGFRVIATTDALFSPWFPHPDGATAEDKLQAGRPFRFSEEALREAFEALTHPSDHGAHEASGPDEAVVGADVARTLGIRPGDRIEPTHGVEQGKAHHEEVLWTVTGVLKRTGTPIDRVVFINLDSFYRIPDHAGGLLPRPDGSGVTPGISAVLLFPAPGVAKGLLLPRLKKRTDIQVADVNEQVRLLLGIVGDVDVVFLLIAVLVVVIGVISVMVAIYNTMNERRREIAILRAIGAHRMTVLSAIVGEATILTSSGAVLGLALGHALVLAAAGYVEQEAGFRPDAFRLLALEALVLAAVTMVGAWAGLVPAWKAYRTDVASNISPLS